MQSSLFVLLLILAPALGDGDLGIDGLFASTNYHVSGSSTSKQKEHRIPKCKAYLLFHLEILPKNSPGKEIYLQQKTQQLPGIIHDPKDIICRLGYI